MTRQVLKNYKNYISNQFEMDIEVRHKKIVKFHLNYLHNTHNRFVWLGCNNLSRCQMNIKNFSSCFHTLWNVQIHFISIKISLKLHEIIQNYFNISLLIWYYSLWYLHCKETYLTNSYETLTKVKLLLCDPSYSFYVMMVDG